MTENYRYTADFIHWLNECPCSWIWLQHAPDSITYKFFPTKMTEEEFYPEMPEEYGNVS